MKSSVTARTAIGFLLTVLFLGCVGEQDAQIQQTSPDGKLYISNLGTGSLLTYGDAVDANGNLAPTQSIQNVSTQNFILSPAAVFVDTINNRLYAANTGINQVLIYDNATAISGTSVPDRVISGVATTLNFPRGLTVDTTNNILYVSNAGSNAILVFDVSNTAFAGPSCVVGAPTTTCNFTPSQSITGLNGPWGLFLDNANNRLYAANTVQNSILVFNNASSAATLARTITFSNLNTTLPIPRLSNPSGIFVDTVNDRFYVANNGNSSVLIFDNASSIDGETTPNRAVSGSQASLSNPTGIFVDVTADPDSNAANGTGVMYVSNSNNSILIFTNASNVNGNVAPNQTISGTATTLISPGGIYVDIGNNQLYAANTGNNAFVVFNNASTATGNIPPDRIISDTVPLSLPGGIAVDTTRDLLYVGKSGSIIIFENASAMQTVPVTETINVSPLLFFPYAISIDSTRDRLYAASVNSILIFNNASSLTGSPSPTDTIPGLAAPVGLFVDSARDLLYVAEIGSSSIKVYSQASTSPTLFHTITGPNLVSVRGVGVDSGRDILYAVSGSSVLVYASASTRSGATTPDRIITGAMTTLNFPLGIIIDPTNDFLYVANSSANSVLVFNNASTATGNIAPDRTIAQGADPVNETMLNMPLGISVDTTK